MKQCAWAHFLEFLCVSTQQNAFYFNFIFVSFFVVWGGWAGVVITSIGFAHTHTHIHMSCYATGRSLALPHAHTHTHVRNATLLDVLLHLHTHTDTSCYTTGHFLFAFFALANRRHATLLDILLHLHTDVMLRYWTFSCTCTQTSCYATGCSLALPHAHTRHAMLLGISFCIFCTCTQASCYATGHSFAFAHRRHATLLDVLLHLHTDVMLRYWMFSCTSTHTHTRHAMLLDILLM